VKQIVFEKKRIIKRENRIYEVIKLRSLRDSDGLLNLSLSEDLNANWQMID
jgi:hypothetical protein